MVDDHPIVRERLAELINRQSDLSVCGEAEDAPQALAAVKSHKPDLAIVDITLKDTYGIELIRDLKNRHPKLPILVLSMHDEALYAERSLRAGAHGYICKCEASDKIIAAIRTILSGGIYASENIKSNLLRRLAGGGSNSHQPRSMLGDLTDRELEILQMIGQARSVRQIAGDLHISAKTVEAHRANIKKKLSLKTSAELTRFAIKERLDQV